MRWHVVAPVPSQINGPQPLAYAYAYDTDTDLCSIVESFLLIPLPSVSLVRVPVL